MGEGRSGEDRQVGAGRVGEGGRLCSPGKKKNSRRFSCDCFVRAGIVLSSRAVASQVFSTRMSLTSVFGMGTGVTSSP